MSTLDPTAALTTALTDWKARADTLAKFKAYYDGDHPLEFASEVFTDIYGDQVKAAADNLCSAVVDVPRDRLKIVGFDVAAEGRDTAELDAEVERIWTENRMPRRSNEIHKLVLRDGDEFDIVWPHPVTGRATIYPHSATQVTAAFDPDSPGTFLWAAKNWTSGGYVGVTLYAPDVVWRYRTKQPAAALPDNAAAFELVEEIANPHGMPVFHRGNNAAPGERGRSVLVDVIPLQDLLNKSVADQVVAMEFFAAPQRYATGYNQSADLDAVLKLRELWTFSHDQVRLGQFDPSDPSSYLAVQDSARHEIARVAGIPAHSLYLGSGDIPSGVALRVAEGRLLAATTDRQVSFGDTTEDEMLFALRLNGIDTDGVTLSTRWADPAPMSTEERLANARAALEAGVPRRQVFIEHLGYDTDKADELLAEADVDADTAATRTARTFAMGGDA